MSEVVVWFVLAVPKCLGAAIYILEAVLHPYNKQVLNLIPKHYTGLLALLTK